MKFGMTVEEIENKLKVLSHIVDDDFAEAIDEARKYISNAATIIDKFLSESKSKWISCSERLPEKPFGCLVTVWDTNPITFDEFENILPYFVGWDGEQWNDADGEQCPFEVVAWMPMPEPYKEKNDETD